MGNSGPTKHVRPPVRPVGVIRPPVLPSNQMPQAAAQPETPFNPADPVNPA